jgi:glycosyltransferase involved in cell wall biosynthesis
VSADADLVGRVSRAARGADGLLLGHFGTYDAPTRTGLQALVPGLLRALPRARLLLLGRGSDAAAASLREGVPDLRDRIAGAGALGAAELSAHLQACDLMVQPYVDGASTRRTTLMAALAHGLPVVTTTGRLSEPFWSGSPAIAAVAAGDVEGMIHAAVRLAGDPSLRQRQAAAARDVYDARFALPHVIRALREDRCDPLTAPAAAG